MTLAEELAERNIDYREGGSHHHVRRGWLGIDCPRCSPRSGKYRLGINLVKGYGTCWVCGHVNAVWALCELTGEPPGVVSSWLARPGTYQEQDDKRVRSKLVAPPGLCQLLPTHKKYLRQRGFDPEQLAKLWGIQGIGRAGGYYSWRIWIPVYQRGKVVSWTSRAIADVKQRYLSASPNQELVSLKHLLYGEDYARNSIVVCEGPTDVWRLGPGAVAVLGLALTEEQIRLIGKYPSVTVCFDNEPDAQLRADKLRSRLKDYRGTCRVISVESAKDVGDADEEEVEFIRHTYMKG